MPQNYVIHTFVIAIAIIIGLVFFLKSQWGHH